MFRAIKKTHPKVAQEK